MTTAAVSHEFDLIQRHLLPPDSVAVRYCMDQASQMSQREDFFTKRLYPIPFVVAAVALSFFNAFSYLIQIPFITLLNVARLAPLRFLTDPFVHIINTARSVLFVGLGLPLLIAGVVFPEAVYTRFAPDAIIAGEGRLAHENEVLRKQVESLEEKLKRQEMLLEAQAALIQRDTKTETSFLDRLKFWQKA